VSVLLAVNIFFMCNRLLQRHICVARVYGGLAALPIVIRWPVAIIINAFASFQAIRQYAISRIAGKKIIWAKTTHEIPDTFEPVSTAIESVAASAEPASVPAGGQP